MSHMEVVLVEWSCDYCQARHLGDEALPEGWQEDVQGGHWCGCARTVDAHILDELRALLPPRPDGPPWIIYQAPTLAEAVDRASA